MFSAITDTDCQKKKICTQLAGAEREKAEKLVLRAIKKHRKDERPIIAAGYSRLKPLLQCWKPSYRAKRQCPPNDTHLQRMGILQDKP